MTLRALRVLFVLPCLTAIVACGADAPDAKADLPKVLIIGDSISIGYTPFVTQAMKKEADVRHHRGNAANTGTGMKMLDKWLGDVTWDVIHFNWGLHDLAYRALGAPGPGNLDKVNGTLSTTHEKYEERLEELVTRLEKTGAILIWATTTVVPEGEPGRIAGDAAKYNQVAARVMTKHGLRVNDLHALTSTFKPDLFIRPGNVHFTKPGSKKIAAQVATSIRAVLPKPKADVKGRISD